MTLGDAPMIRRTRLRIGVWLLVIDAIGLAGASMAMLTDAPGLASALGRHLRAGALANIALALLLATIAWIPLRRGQQWALWAYGLAVVIYGVPILVMDASHVDRAKLVTTLAPQVAGLVVWLLGSAFAAAAVGDSSAGDP
jgi:hypothetical protein